MNKTYERNMKALEVHVPRLKAWIEEQKPVDWIDKIHSNTGGVNALVKSESGQVRPIYPMESPQKDIKLAVKKFKLHRNTASVVVGMGCGYMMKQLVKNRESKHKILVVEPIADFYKIAFSLFDYSKAIKKGWIFFMTNEDDIRYIFQKAEEYTMLEDWYITIDQYTNVRPEYTDLRERVFKTISSLRCNTGTVEGAGSIIAENDIKSLPYVIEKRGVAELAGIFKGKPAICVSTGPSLEKNIHLLLDEEVRKKFVILAVGQALRVLLAYGIKPDLATSVDFGIVNYTHYKGLLDCGVPLVALNRSYAPLLQNWQGPLLVSVSESPGYEGTITELLQAKGSLIQGGSVAHMNVGLALHMGCDPVTIIGQDLAWEGDRTHTRLADESGMVHRGENGSIGWEVDDPNTVIKKKQQAMGEAIPLMGYYGKAVYTNAGLLAFHSGFEQIFSLVDARIINATEGGAMIKNCDQLSLQQVIDECGKDPIDKTPLKQFLLPAENAKKLKKKAIELLTADIDNMKQIISECDSALNACDKLVKPKVSEKDKKELLAINEKHSIEARKRSQKNALVMLSIYRVSREISHRDLLPDGKVLHLVSKDGRKDLLTRIKRNRKILEAAMEASKKFIPLYQDSLKLVKTGVGEPEKEPLSDLSDAEQYFKLENWAHPLLDAERILSKQGKETLAIARIEKAKKVRNEAIDRRNITIRRARKEYKDRSGVDTVLYNKLIEGAQKAGREDKDFNKSAELLEQALTIKPKEESVLWGLASTYHFIGRDKESAKHYETLIKAHPDNLQYQFEKAIVDLKRGETKLALSSFEFVMSKTKKYNHFYKSLCAIYLEAGLWEEALIAAGCYLKDFGADWEGWKLKGDCLKALGEDSSKAYEKAKKIKPV